MTLRQLIGFIATALLLVLALAIGHRLWVHYMDEPWTRDGRVRAQIVGVAPDVSGAVVELPVADNMFVRKGQVLMRIDPAHYQVAVEQAEAAVAARRAEFTGVFATIPGLDARNQARAASFINGFFSDVDSGKIFKTCSN